MQIKGSLLDSKEIKSVNPKGNQPWILVGRTDAEDEAPVFWSSDENSWLTAKVPNSGQDWGRRRGRQRMRWLNGTINAMHMNLGKLQEMVRDRGLTCYCSWGGKESDTTGWLNNNMQTILGLSNFPSESIPTYTLHSAQSHRILTLKSL